MEFIKQEDLDLITACAGKEINEADHNKLSIVYNKLEHICILLRDKGFDFSIRKDPRRMAGQGSFKFQEYHWAKVYPSRYRTFSEKKFAYIIGFTDVVHFHLMGIKELQDHPASLFASKSCWTELDIENSSYEDIVNSFVNFDKQYRNLFIKTGAVLGIKEFIKIVEQMKKSEVINLLMYKKQIILQGPPGTGKTKLAKEIAKRFCRPNYITANDITSAINVNQKIECANKHVEQVDYTIKSISANRIILVPDNSDTEYTVSYNEIIDAFSLQSWNGLPRYGNEPYVAAIAKFIYKNYYDKNQLKLIQFHPAYSYEDFVRGIVAKPNEEGEGIIYKAENKLLGEFAREANRNYLESLDTTSIIETGQSSFQKKLNIFIDKVQAAIDSTGEFVISDDTTAKIVRVVNDGFIYSFAKRSDIKYKLLYADLIKIFNSPTPIEKTIDVRDIAKGYLEMIGKHPYYFKVFKLIESIELANEPEEKEQPTLKSYVLIIDEINRANLSSVLGELIYALEYRGEAVESMYAIDGDNKLTLPPNLYIIGTMNTADRSVGHIDYAIRRRFAFVDVLPTIEPITVGKERFRQVSELFIKNYDSINWDKLDKSEHLTADFRPEDVWLGHSYFITKDKDDFGNLLNEQAQLKQLNTKLKYEVLPILKEYVKDGILLETSTVNEVIDELSAIK